MEWIIDDISEVLAVTDVKISFINTSIKARGKTLLFISMKLFWLNMIRKQENAGAFIIPLSR